MGFFDGIFLNENDDIQECSSSNILFEKDGKYYSPYIQSGILFGITLQTLKDHLNIEFLPIKAKDLKEFERAFILNSVIYDTKTRLYKYATKSQKTYRKW